MSDDAYIYLFYAIIALGLIVAGAHKGADHE